MKSVLDSRQLLAARALADTGSFTLAGRQLCLTQSAVSHAIKALEEEVECRLFTRSGKGVTVTPAGKYFLEYTDRILGQMETARTLVAPRTTRGKERLRLGVGMRARAHIMPVVLPTFQKEFPNKLVTIEPGNYVQNLQLLESGLLDFVFAVRPSERPDLGYIPLYEDELRFVVGRDHPWAQTGQVSRKDLAGDMLVAALGINRVPQLLADYFRAEKITPGHMVEMPDYESIRILVKSNVAVGVLSPALFWQDIQNGSLVSLPLGPRPLLRQWGLVYPARHPLTVMDKRFIELCQQAVPGILSRLQGQSLEVVEKKASPPPVPTAEPTVPSLRYGDVALAFAAAFSFLSDSMAWTNWGSAWMAA